MDTEVRRQAHHSHIHTPRATRGPATRRRLLLLFAHHWRKTLHSACSPVCIICCCKRAHTHTHTHHFARNNSRACVWAATSLKTCLCAATTAPCHRHTFQLAACYTHICYQSVSGRVGRATTFTPASMTASEKITVGPHSLAPSLARMTTNKPASTRRADRHPSCSPLLSCGHVCTPRKALMSPVLTRVIRDDGCLLLAHVALRWSVCDR
jgi:hypothetical protein